VDVFRQSKCVRDSAGIQPAGILSLESFLFFQEFPRGVLSGRIYLLAKFAKLNAINSTTENRNNNKNGTIQNTERSIAKKFQARPWSSFPSNLLPPSQLPWPWLLPPLTPCGWSFVVSWLPLLPLWCFVRLFVSKATSQQQQFTPPPPPAFSRLSHHLTHRLTHHLTHRLTHRLTHHLFVLIATIRKMSADKSVGSLPLLPYSSMVASAFIWVTYGILKGEPKIWSSNGIGLILGAYYFVEFMRHSPEKSKTLPGAKLQHKQAVAAVLLATTAAAIAPLSILSSPCTWIGRAGVVFCLVMFASPLSALGTVLQQRSAKAIPLPLAVTSVVNCFLWSVAGLFQMKDVNVYFPNLLGLSFGLAQVALKLFFGDGPNNVKREPAVNLPT